MTTLVEKLKVKSPIKSKFEDEFQTYLKAQCLKTTFNGIELETFSWYKKMLGLMQFKPRKKLNAVLSKNF